LALGVCVCLAAACSSSGGGSGASSGGSSGPTAASGPVTVLYAGSLVDLMQKQLGPAFTSADGVQISGISAGSTALATQIKGKVHKGDVFISASPTVNQSLTGSANGNWVSWYGTFATSALVIGYNPKSKFAKAIRTRPWYDVVTEPGFRLGLTDPATDPKGKLAAQALTDTATKQHLSALSTIASDSSDVFPEETLVGRLQAGQLDAGFFYTSEAAAAKIPTVPVTGESLKATYTVTVLNRAPHPGGAAAFVAYLLGANGQATLKQDGFTLISPPQVTGSGVPGALQSVLPAAS
jgi:molybdate/tungstate transport system substrate-binding protein